MRKRVRLGTAMAGVLHGALGQGAPPSFLGALASEVWVRNVPQTPMLLFDGKWACASQRKEDPDAVALHNTTEGRPRNPTYIRTFAPPDAMPGETLD